MEINYTKVLIMQTHFACETLFVQPVFALAAFGFSAIWNEMKKYK